MIVSSPYADLKQALILISPKVLSRGGWKSDPVAESRLQRLGEFAGILAAATSQAYPDQARAAWAGACQGALSEALRDTLSREETCENPKGATLLSSLSPENAKYLIAGLGRVATVAEHSLLIDGVRGVSYSEDAQQTPDEWESFADRCAKHLENLRHARKWHPRSRILQDALADFNEFQRQFNISTLNASQPPSFWDRDAERVQRAQTAFLGGDLLSGPVQEIATGASEAAIRAALRRSPEGLALFKSAMTTLEAGLRDPRFAHATTLSISALNSRWLGLLSGHPELAPLAHQALRLATLREDIAPMSQNFKEAWALAYLSDEPTAQERASFEDMAKFKISPSWGTDQLDFNSPELAPMLALGQIRKALGRSPDDVDLPLLIRSLNAIERPDESSNQVESKPQQELRERCEEGLARWGRSLTMAGHACQWSDINKRLASSGAAAWARAPQEGLREDVERQRPLDAIIETLCSGSVPGDPGLITLLIYSLSNARNELTSQLENQEITQFLSGGPVAAKTKARL